MNRIDVDAVNALRVLAADEVQKANSGHPDLPLGAGRRHHACKLQMVARNGQRFVGGQFMNAAMPRMAHLHFQA